MKQRDPWYPFAYEAYDRDTKDLSDAADLLYRRLLTVLWTNGGFIPKDWAWIGKRVRKRADFVQRVFEEELTPFFTIMSDEMYQKRMLEEVNKAAAIGRKRADSSNARWGEENELSQDELNLNARK